MVFLLLLALIVLVALLMIGCVVALILFLIGSGVTILGITATSALSAWVQKSPAAAVRAIVCQLGALLGVPVGAVTAWIWMALSGWLGDLDSPWPPVGVLAFGAVLGAALGLAVAALFVVVWTRIVASIRESMAARQAAARASLTHPTSR